MATPPPQTVAFAFGGPILRADLPALCARFNVLLAESRAEIALCHVDGAAADAVTVDALARLQLAALQHGCRVRVRGAPDELLELVDFMGLTDVLPP